jgi:hypothetical protein
VTTSPTIYGSILHGAYGDYYEQAVCLKHFRLSHPDTRMKLFAAAPNRLAELRVLDFSWAECFELYTEIPGHHIDSFFQFQTHDRELRSGVLSKLPPEVLGRLDLQENRLPWHYLRSILPLTPEQQLGLSDLGRSALPNVMQANGIDPEVFRRPTIGFLWRHRAPGGAVKPAFQSDAMQLAAKYSRLFRKLIDTYGCHILICGMKVERTQENMYRIDAKYPEYGLDLPPQSSTHLKGLSWALELEVLSRCTVCVANPSGFSEALWIKRGGGVLLADPPPHYLAKALWHRVPLFNLQRPSGMLSAVASRSENAAFSQISAALARSLRQPGDHAVTTLQNIAR